MWSQKRTKTKKTEMEIERKKGREIFCDNLTTRCFDFLKLLISIGKNLFLKRKNEVKWSEERGFLFKKGICEHTWYQMIVSCWIRGREEKWRRKRGGRGNISCSITKNKIFFVIIFISFLFYHSLHSFIFLISSSNILY